MIPPLCEYYNHLRKSFGNSHAWEWLTDNYEVKKFSKPNGEIDLLINGQEYTLIKGGCGQDAVIMVKKETHGSTTNF